MHTPFTRVLLLSLVLVLGAPELASAAPPPDDEPALVSGPVLGYVLDSRTHSLRPINGIPGSSHIGTPLNLAFPVTAFALSSASSFALVVSGEGDHPVYLIRNFGTGSRFLESIEGAVNGADRIVLNADSSAAALYSAEARRLQIVRGLPDHPQAGPLLDLSSISGQVTALALDRRGARLLITASDGEQGGLYLFDTSADPQALPRRIANFPSPSALALLHEDRDVVVADATLNQLVLTRDFAGSADAFLLAGERDGMSNPVGIEISADGSRIFIANDGTRSLDVWNLATQSTEARMALDAAPSRLVRLQGPATFLLNDVGDDPLLILDTSENLAVYFVPAGRDQ